MSFDKFFVAVESRDLSQADKSIIRVSSFPKLFLNDNIIDPRRDVCIQFFYKTKVKFWARPFIGQYIMYCQMTAFCVC